MIERLTSLLYASEPVAFYSALTREQAVASLRAAVSLPAEAALGTVTENTVVLRRAIPHFDNAFKAFFVGRFSAQSGDTVLEGTFTVHWTMRAMMALWCGFVVLWTLLTLVDVVSNPGRPRFFPLAGLGMLLLGLAFMRIAQWRGRHDQEFLVELIETALGGNADGNVGRTFP